MHIELEGVEWFDYKADGKLYITPEFHDEDFWLSMMRTVLEGDAECTADFMVQVSPEESLLLFAALAEELNKQKTLPAVRVTKTQQTAIDIIRECVEGSEKLRIYAR